MNVTNLGLSWNSRYLELSPTEMAIAIVAALLVGGAALYVLLKVLRSKPVKMLGMGLLLAAIALIGWLALDQHQQDERTRVSEIWSRTFENSARLRPTTETLASLNGIFFKRDAGTAHEMTISRSLANVRSYKTASSMPLT